MDNNDSLEIIERNTSLSFRDLVETNGIGAVVKDTGDGSLAVFAEPIAAVTSALGIQSAIAAHPHFKLRVDIDMDLVSAISNGGIIADELRQSMPAPVSAPDLRDEEFVAEEPRRKVQKPLIKDHSPASTRGS